jgi:hypothetical protein
MAGERDCSEMVGGFSGNVPSILSVSFVIPLPNHQLEIQSKLTMLSENKT